MAKERFIACAYYACEGECLKGKKGTFYGACQKCKLYLPARSGRPARLDLHKQKREAAIRREAQQSIRNY